MDKKMFLVRVACGAGASICAWRVWRSISRAKITNVKSVLSPRKPTS